MMPMLPRLTKNFWNWLIPTVNAVRRHPLFQIMSRSIKKFCISRSKGPSLLFGHFLCKSKTYLTLASRAIIPKILLTRRLKVNELAFLTFTTIWSTIQVWWLWLTRFDCSSSCYQRACRRKLGNTTGQISDPATSANWKWLRSSSLDQARVQKFR